MPKRSRGKLQTLVAITIAIAVFGNDLGCAINHSYPVWPEPEKPHLEIKDPGQRAVGSSPETLNCMSAEDLRGLNSYVIDLEQQVKQYRCEIQTINGDRCHD